MIRAEAVREHGRSIPPSGRPENPPHATLAERHTQYLRERGVDPEATPGMFWTASKPSEIPEPFSAYQRRRAPALVAEFHSPDGETVAYQTHPDYPGKDRKGKVVKWMSPPGKNARTVLGVVPGFVEDVRTGTGPLWIGEGVTRGAAAARFSIPFAAFSGCWGWQSGGDPLECWRHVNLLGRLVFVALDADHHTNENVHKALAALVAFLEGRGARVLVVDVPEVDGDPNTGLDDWIAANGHPATLERAAQPFKPVDVPRERLSKDKKLAVMVGDLWRAWGAMPTVKRGECTDRSTARELIRDAERRGKPRADGIEVRPSLRTLAQAVGVSVQGQSNSLERLEKTGFLRPVTKPRKINEAQAYILLSDALKGRALGRHKGRKGHQQGGEGKEQNRISLLSQAESFPRVNLTRYSDEVPELRWPTILRRQERDERGQLVEVYEYLARLGKKRGEIVRFLLESGGVTTIPELMERFASPHARSRDFRRRNLDMLTDLPAIVLVEGDVVSLTPNWREALENARKLAGEQEAAKLQAEKIARQREAFRQRAKHQADPEPEMPQVDDMRDPWSVHPNGCACRDCVQRFGRVIGEHVEGCRCAVCFEAFKKAAREKSSRRVVPLQPRKKPEREVDREIPAPVVELRADLSSRDDNVYKPSSRDESVSFIPPNASDDHPLDCLCGDCEFPPPHYARPVGSRA